MARNNINHKMTHILNVDEVFTYANTVLEPLHVYIDLDSTSKLLKVTPTLYKNVPNFRSKIIQNSKSYDLNKTIFDILDLLSSNYSSNYKNNKLIEKICIVSDNKAVSEYIINKKMNFTIVSNKQFIENVANDKKSILLVDVNDSKTKLMSDKKNVHVMVLQLIK